MPLTAEGCVARREQLVSTVDADYLIVTNPRHIFYLTGFYVTPLTLGGWGPNFLTIDARTGKSSLLVHNFIVATTDQEPHVDDLQVWRWYDSATDPGVALFSDAVNQLNARLPDVSGRRVGVEFGWLPRGVNVSDVLDITPALLALRRRKYPDELTLIRQAVRAVEAGHRAARAVIRPGISELDVYNAVYAAIVSEAGGPVLPLGDFVSGERAYGVGGPPTQRTLRAGEVMILDLFPIIDGYRADFTATVLVDGGMSDKLRALEEALHAGIAAGEALLRPGSRANDIHRAVREALAAHGFGAGFSHHAGHGLGLDHPEAPYFVPNSQEVLQEGDVVTLEPGAYGADFGGRIEHNYLITADGFERLTQHSTSFASR